MEKMDRHLQLLLEFSFLNADEFDLFLFLFGSQNLDATTPLLFMPLFPHHPRCKTAQWY